jgi:hypothetical protein
MHPGRLIVFLEGIGLLFLLFPLAGNSRSYAMTNPAPFLDYRVTRPPSITPERIDQILAEAHSPAAGLGEAVFKLGVKYGIDPSFALAFYHHESVYGRTGEARKTYSTGNERCIPDRLCIDRQRGGYAQMYSWLDGFDHWFRLIAYGYVEGHVTIPLVGHRCITVDEIIPVYAPSSDHNNVKAFINAVKHDVDTWNMLNNSQSSI